MQDQDQSLPTPTGSGGEQREEGRQKRGEAEPVGTKANALRDDRCRGRLTASQLQQHRVAPTSVFSKKS